MFLDRLQTAQIIEGEKQNINTQSFSNPEFNWHQMYCFREKLVSIKNMDPLSQAKSLYQELVDTPKTTGEHGETIAYDFLGFGSGTSVEEVEQWLERSFSISIPDIAKPSPFDHPEVAKKHSSNSLPF